ncbi:MAG: hypothetical protein LBU81_01860 [Methanosarcinales archaeon]|jgi:hypothetical protein|nr:hypothetical protein [Methanosarcinales archaeon]
MTIRPNGKKVSTPNPDEIFKDMNPRVYTKEDLKKHEDRLKEISKAETGWKLEIVAVQEQTIATCIGFETPHKGL